MAKATCVYNTPPTNTPEICELALHEQLKAAGMRLQRAGNDRYTLIWRRQMVVSDLTLLQAAMFIDRALVRR
jgi:hypothetical protein